MKTSAERGALALVLSERVSWPTVYAIMGGFMALVAWPISGQMLDNLPMGSLIPTEVQIGGVTILDLPIEHYEEIG